LEASTQMALASARAGVETASRAKNTTYLMTHS
jgi:hypothetical protein